MEEDDGDPIIAHTEYAFPDDKLEDWVSYADQVSEIEVVSESRGALTGEAEVAREGYVSRTIEVRIGETIWWNPEVREEPETGELRLGAIGWHQRGNKLIRLRALEAPRLNVGGIYVVPLQWHGKSWSLLTNRCTFAANGDETAEADVAMTKHGEVAAKLSGMSYAAIHDLLTSTQPYKAAAMHWDLPPSERLAAVQSSQLGDD